MKLGRRCLSRPRCMDFFFVGDEDQNEKLAVLAARERTTRMTMSTVAPIGADTGDITLKSDQEPAMKALLSEVLRHRAVAGGGRTAQWRTARATGSSREL